MTWALLALTLMRRAWIWGTWGKWTLAETLMWYWPAYLRSRASVLRCRQHIYTWFYEVVIKYMDTPVQTNTGYFLQNTLYTRHTECYPNHVGSLISDNS